eukprot:SAG11_NODE_22373_length_407_cov_0.831169_1_plen_54_part_10
MDCVFAGSRRSSFYCTIFGVECVDSAYGFGGGIYHFPVSGCTHREGVEGKNHAQ